MGKNKDEKIDFNQIAQLAKTNPKYASLLSSLAQIDSTIKKMIADEIENIDDGSQYFIKTELMNRCYMVYLYYVPRRLTVATSWTISDFLLKCENKIIEYDIKVRVEQMISRFKAKQVHSDKINWV